MTDITLDISTQTITINTTTETIALDTGGTGPTGLSGVTGEIIALTQEQYDGLAPDPAVLYVITT